MTFGRILVLALATLALVPACSGDDDDDDCTAAKTELSIKQTDKLGEECFVANYGTCKTAFSTCIEGECKQGPSGRTCANACTSTAGCASGFYCIGGYCLPPAKCSTVCDGATCCKYSLDPDDPTKCRQTTCTKT